MKNSLPDPDVERDERLALLLADLTDRAQSGEAINLESVCSEYPDLSDELRQLWGAVMVADAAGNEPTLASNDDTKADKGVLSFELPCQFGDYELLEEIGRGGMGVVYRARQASLNRTVALKMLLRGQLASPAERERFRAEAEAAARLDHPSIVPVFDVGEEDGRTYFSMKFILGQTLTELLEDRPLSSRDAARLMVPVVRAINYAHEQGVLHRDLKPSNVLIDGSGDAHVMDFGLAKKVSDTSSLTKTGAVVGTPAYMSPEQAAGARGEVGPASDVYSLGTILYHAVTGKPPFRASSPVDTLLMVLEQDPVPPRTINPKIDRDLEMIIVRCLQKPADLRYQTAGALADDLEAFVNDELISARSGRAVQIMGRLFRETHHAAVLENWGLLWMWHSLVLFGACLLTMLLKWSGVEQPLAYFAVWSVGFGTWAGVFWALRRRMGPVTFVERQIAHVWAASMICIALLFPVERGLGLDVLTLSPVVALVSGMVFLVKAGILTGAFYVQAFVLFATAFLMVWQPDYGHLIFGVISAACFFFPGLKYYRRRQRSIARGLEF